MAESLFQNLESQAFRAGVTPRTDESRKWFRQKIQQMGKVNRQQILKDPLLDTQKRFVTGKMFMFFYDPKYRETLPYYDAFPLTIMISPAPGGFYGLNLHYLSPMVRARFLDKLMALQNNRNNDETTRLKLTYNMLQGAKKYREFKPCFKHYLTKHVDSRIVRVDPPEWEIAVFLPTEQFRKQSKSRVWGQSKRSFSS